MTRSALDEQYADEEAARRRDEVVKRMLNTPPQPRTSVRPPRTPAHSYVVVDGTMRVAVGEMTPGSEATVDLYRNLDDLRAGRALEPGVKITVAG